MRFFKGAAITVLVLVLLGGLLELGLRAFMPSTIEAGARIALGVPQTSEVTVAVPGSMALNALRWRVADVTITADDAPLAEGIEADAELSLGSVPLLPTFGRLQDGSASFTIPAEHLDGVARLLSGGNAQWGENREREFVVGGVLTDEQFDLPHSPSFEIEYEGTIRFSIENGDVVVTPTNVEVHAGGMVGDFLRGAMMEPRTICIANSLPKGITLTDIDLLSSGAVRLSAQLSEGLLSRVDERFPGSCS